MAERIDILKQRLGPPTVYPWHEWTDGSTWRIKRGEDFTIPTNAMRASLHTHANRKGLSVATSTAEDESYIDFQFSVREPTEAAA